MNRIIDILMKRDGNTKREAEGRVKEVQRMMEDCNYNPDESERIMAEQLGLELDYIMDLI
ncbi:hypothetical protein [Faecalicoccus pleomorphus]|uniref:hypothetical protein n=1 Tax=Faecalicoccus pleomorphus TaxID=1323 RepID=UPI002430647B|nr:hypothetical protein [Faecalicoccus pleomorphus]